MRAYNAPFVYADCGYGCTGSFVTARLSVTGQDEVQIDVHISMCTNGS